ncbi:MAG: DNA-directed RNA polymerase subunit beta', partial [Erysipelotrichaceae bacterium]|nr:DNA-directed RNA polymerase subunit beta' [Erysipelotrichaceae bacterium]
RDLPVSNEVNKSGLGDIIGAVFKRYEDSEGNTYKIFDKIKDNGFYFSTVSGMSISLDDIQVSPNKEKYVEEGKKEQANINDMFDRGLMTLQDKDRALNKLWETTKNHLGDELMEALPRKNPIFMMAHSGARGNKSHFTQLAGMRGLMGKPTQSKSTREYESTIIEVPIYSNFREGLNVSEFFISTHGVRKGLTDTALKTAESGYLTRRLVDVAQAVMIMEEDCQTDQGYYVEDIIDQKDNSTIEKFYDRIVGRYAKEQLTDPETGEIIIDEDEFIDEQTADRIIAAGYKGMNIRNSFTCKCKDGICRKCYGRNMATGKLVESGEAIGIMAAQSIGEPGTQLTMRTFHSGGVANADDDITQGLPRVEELFEARCPKHPAVLAKITGEITKVEELEDHSWVIEISNDKETIVHKCGISSTVRAWIKVGEQVKAGAKLTEGNVDPKELLSIAGVQAVQNYILKEVKKVYAVTGIDISDKHVEVIIKQMLKKVIIVEPGGSELCAGQTISLKKLNDLNTQLLFAGKQPAKFEPLLLGISKSSVETDSFLSAASFQETTKVLTDAAVNGKVDNLFGIKENVIIGKLIPAGTGSKFERETTNLVRERAEELDEIREEKLLAAQEEASLPSEMIGDLDEDGADEIFEEETETEEVEE